MAVTTLARLSAVTPLARLTAAALLAGAAPVAAATFGVEAATDLRRRGLSWSDGKPAIEGWASLPITGGLSIEAGGASLRGSPRHGGAAALAEAGLRYGRTDGPLQLWTEVQGHGFIGGDAGFNYAEWRGGGALGLGPAQLSAQFGFAPRQAAIGGSNLAVGARLSVGVIGTPLTLAAGAGYTTGSDDGSGRAQRLRPGGAYGDFRVDADYATGPVTIGISLVTTTIAAADLPADVPADFAGNTGTRLLLRAGVNF
jgi:hypothetical protein